MLSRAKPATGAGRISGIKGDRKTQELPKLEDFLQKRDYTGAITLLEVSELRITSLDYFSLYQ